MSLRRRRCTDTDVTVRPMIRDSARGVEVADRAGQRAHAADDGVGGDPLHTAAEMGGQPDDGRDPASSAAPRAS